MSLMLALPYCDSFLTVLTMSITLHSLLHHGCLFMLSSSPFTLVHIDDLFSKKRPIEVQVRWYKKQKKGDKFVIKWDGAQKIR